MTIINRIAIHGFKSFAHKTEVPLDGKYNCILGPNGSGKCVTGDTRVYLANGTILPIKHLVDQKSMHGQVQEIDDGFIYEGDNTEILCLNTETYKIERKKIKNYVKRTAPEKLLQIKTRSGRAITSTPYHPLFILNENRIVSARADELKEGIKVAVPRSINVEPETKIFIELLDEITEKDELYVPWSEALEVAIRSREMARPFLSEKAQIPKAAVKSFVTDKQAINFAYLVRILRVLGFENMEIVRFISCVKAKVGSKVYPFPWKNTPSLARLLGYLLAEGRLTNSNQIWFTNGTEELVQDYVNLMKEVFSERAVVNEYKINAWDVVAYSKPLQIILSKFGMPLGGRTDKKTISNLYFSHCSNKELAELLNGLYCGDGYVSKNTIEITTKSKKLASAIQFCLTRLGILYQSREVIKIATNTGFSGRYVSISIYGADNFIQFFSAITFMHPDKQKRLVQLLGKKGNTNVDLIEANSLVRQIAIESKINIKKTKKQFPKLDAYCYNQCTPSRQGIQQLIEELFLKTGAGQTQALLQLQRLSTANVYWDEIVEIKEVAPSEKWVYDLCVDEHHNFIANNIFVHNSNVGDALCFVLGRLSAKSMRAEKAANLIFNGGKDKKPASSAYVEIAFDNKNKTFPIDAKEVVINRTIHKEGSSVYRVNGEKKTRTEVLDVLATARINPEGYNIVLQGDVTRFVDMPTQERRRIIEEISDVSIYEEKKHKALLELQKVEEKLNNADIILAERKTYLKELKKDRDQAMKFKELKDLIDSNKATYIHAQMKEREAVKSVHDEEITKQQEKIKSLDENAASLRKKADGQKEEIANINKEIEQKGEKEQLKVHRQIEDLKVSLAEDKTRVSTLKDEINKIKQRKDQFAVEMDELNEKASAQDKQQQLLQQNINVKQKELQELEKNIALFKKKHKIESSQELEKEMEQKDLQIEQKQEEAQSVRQKQQELVREKDQIEFQLGSLDERIAKVKEVEKEHKQQMEVLQKHKNDFKAATLKLNKCLEQDSSYASQLGNARRKLAEVQEKQAHLNAKTLSYQANLATDLAVRSILENKKKFREVHGTIVELGQVNKKYAYALEASAGARMNHLVVEDDKTAADCIAYLKENKLGSASFIPLNKIRYNEISAEDQKLLKKPGVHDFALNLVAFKPQYKKAFAYVFGKTLVVEDLDSARKIGVGTNRMVTLDGSLAEESGVMRGGFSARKASLGFKEKDSLEELEKVEKELAEWQGVIAGVEQKRDINLQEITSLRTSRAELEAEVIKLEKSLHLDTHDLEASNDLKKELQVKLTDVDSSLTSVQKDIMALNKDLADLKSRKQALRLEVNQLRDPRLLAQLSAFEDSRQKCREDTLRMESDLKNLLSRMEQLLAPEKEKIKEISRQHDKEEQKFTAEIARLASSIQNKEKELELKEKESREFYSSYKGLFAVREKLSAEVNKAEHEIENLREKSRDCEREVNLISLKNAEVKAKLAGLQEEFSKYKDAKLLENKSVEELKQEISKFEVMLSQMSAVNMKALEVYEQVEVEFNKLMEKKAGLGKEKTDVLTLMNEIETKKKEQFMRTFDKANDNFQKIFSTLFTKGKAYLELETAENPFEGGLNIKVRLTGNRFMDIKSLSGGEKTLTALSFIFAIQEYQPASFYILDEIDAALDKQNSEILAKLIRSYADRAQYVVISHNDSIISEADTLFGVSMKDGVSKVTSLKI